MNWDRILIWVPLFITPGSGFQYLQYSFLHTLEFEQTGLNAEGFETLWLSQGRAEFLNIENIEATFLSYKCTVPKILR